MEIKEIKEIVDEASKAITTQAADAQAKAEEAMTKAAEFLSNLEVKADKTETAELQKQFDALSTKFNTMQNAGGSMKKTNFIDEVKENKEAIRNIVLNKSAKEIVLKADTLRSSVQDSEQSFHLPNIGQLGVKDRTLYNVLPKINVPLGDHNGTISYVDWDEATIVRAAAAIAEGDPFPESTAKFKYYKEELKKVGDILPVSEEFGEDQVSAAAELSRFIAVNVEQEVSRQLAVGDGTSNQFRGLLNRALDYTATGANIADANLKDLVRKMRTAIVKTRGSKYRPDFVAMNSDTYDTYFLAKDNEGRYLFDENGTIAGLTVVEDNFIPDNELVVGDRRFASIYQMGGIVLSEGFVGDQFGEDLKSIKARKRCMMLIREVDRTGFLHCSDIDADLATLEGASAT